MLGIVMVVVAILVALAAAVLAYKLVKGLSGDEWNGNGNGDQGPPPAK